MGDLKSGNTIRIAKYQGVVTGEQYAESFDNGQDMKKVWR